MFKRSFLAIIFSLLTLSACSDGPAKLDSSEQTAVPAEVGAPIANSIEVGTDYHSLSNPEEVMVNHLSLDLNINFEQKVIAGTVELLYTKTDPDAATLILDTKNISINKITSAGNDLVFNLDTDASVLGSALEITLPAEGNTLTIDYATSPTASGVQWLTPAQTAGVNTHSYLLRRRRLTHAALFRYRTHQGARYL